LGHIVDFGGDKLFVHHFSALYWKSDYSDVAAFLFTKFAHRVHRLFDFSVAIHQLLYNHLFCAWHFLLVPYAHKRIRTISQQETPLFE
jgi:hypothetical protein